MTEELYTLITRADNKYNIYMSACEEIAREAQKRIDWNDDVSCEYYPGDGICIQIDLHVCPAALFFELGNKISENTYLDNCI